MKHTLVTLAALLSVGVGAPCLASTAPFGVASAYNVVALGNGSTAGNITSNTPDVEGRIAAANSISGGFTVGSTLGSDPYGSLANGYAVVAGSSISGSFNINGGGNVYAPSSTAGFNFNDHGSLVKTGPDPINFTSLASSMDSLSVQLGMLAATGITGAPTPNGVNPSLFVLSGTSTTLNIFTITAAQFDNKQGIDIQVPAGSTVIINVLGTTDTLGAGIYFNGQQESDTNNDGGDILFNFASATSVTIDGQFDAGLLAPLATLTGTSQMGGNFIVAAMGNTGEVHYDPFEGTLPPTGATPEPGSLLLLATGLAAMAVLVRGRARA